ncbi:MAG: VPLPA-CTERM sorting domain-containing protein [Gammaproteobacteria bacterium]|nr:VPLPA-CTERM sorting domain-containing protein [Gammaproteobacteria bacterium]MCB1852385.1 VPLPA-CTERM sorting domain-containing protein [Gammaproteobacteria bacterium]
MQPLIPFPVFKRHARSAAGLLLALGFYTSNVSATLVFVNELHYDNTGSDKNEGVEIAGPNGFTLTGWQLLLYNGGGGNLYGTHGLDGTIPDLGSGFGVLSFSIPGLQNGPDGLALVNNLNQVVQFLSYEGSFTAIGGAADGLASTEIGVMETGSTDPFDSLQLVGSGRRYQDFQWLTQQPNSFGAINSGQTITPAAVPTPATLPLLISGVAGIGLLTRRRKVLS